MGSCQPASLLERHDAICNIDFGPGSTPRPSHAKIVIFGTSCKDLCLCRLLVSFHHFLKGLPRLVKRTKKSLPITKLRINPPIPFLLQVPPIPNVLRRPSRAN
ncbi:hypothetical protein CGRA01v4_11386 [Colletotrichum graminicola]|nr:hypothetical protein CGRA01v4_11386 [Colletotrichum graminicola]